ncbi:hypothetical protein PLESTF_000247000 [Pleodorina starrii]|nr:hypothetical protein PLESTM_001381800 [Pleodorina starrii]GLC65104.1 hypothetical protein PLESTF_000247000 [Pleodorina starrii]
MGGGWPAGPEGQRRRSRPPPPLPPRPHLITIYSRHPNEVKCSGGGGGGGSGELVAFYFGLWESDTLLLVAVAVQKMVVNDERRCGDLENQRGTSPTFPTHMTPRTTTKTARAAGDTQESAPPIMTN